MSKKQFTDLQAVLQSSSPFLEGWLEVVEILPLELQRNFSLMKELDADAKMIMQDAEDATVEFLTNAPEKTEDERMEMIRGLTKAFTKCVQHSEDKVSLTIQTYDMVGRQVKMLDQDLARYQEEFTQAPAKAQEIQQEKEIEQKKKKEKPKEAIIRNVIAKNAPSPIPPRGSTPALTSKKAAPKKKIENVADHPPSTKNDPPIDPNEPKYCYCNQVSFGEMVACDNEACPTEWFHYECVGLDAPPKGKWYCTECQEAFNKARK